MPSDFPRSPRFLKGALVAYPSQFLGPIPNVIAFQYNPDELKRTLTHRGFERDKSDKSVAREDVYRVKGPPVEEISITVDLDATDQLAEPDRHQHVTNFGLHPALAALELLLYPDSAQVLINFAKARAGEINLIDAGAATPLVLFVWGKSRVLPVHLTSFSITEQAFDQQLNPIRATVDLSMTVLTYVELEKGKQGFNVYLTNQTQKEALARLNLINTAEQISGLLPF